MSRHLIILNSEETRRQARIYVNSAPLGTRVEFKASKRSLPQNDFMWSILTDIAAQAEHNGRKYTPDAWKVIFLYALGRETQFIPALDGKTFLPTTQSSSDLSKKEMSELLDFISAWAAENSVILHAGDMVR